MSILNIRPLLRARRHEQVRRHRSKSFLCLPVLAALLVCVLPQAANAAEWSQVEVANPPKTLKDNLLGAACAGGLCFAVGFTIGNGELPLIEEGAGSMAKQEIAVAGGERLLAISCAEKGCATVGRRESPHHGFAYYTSEAAGKKFEVQSTPEPSGSIQGELTAVSCSRPSACTAVGKWENSSHVQSTFAVVLRSGKWELQSTTNPSGVKAIYPAGVSCPAASEGKVCEMTGYYENSVNTLLPFAERWNGTSWSLQTVPTPEESIGVLVHAVSCTKSTECTMVGVWGNKEGADKTLAERWNGTAWKIQITRNVEGRINELYGVSCTSATQCIAVGEFGPEAAPIGQAEIWNGTEWTFQKTTKAAAKLRAIGCSSSSFCLSAGWVTNSFEELLWAELYR